MAETPEKNTHTQTNNIVSCYLGLQIDDECVYIPAPPKGWLLDGTYIFKGVYKLRYRLLIIFPPPRKKRSFNPNGGFKFMKSPPFFATLYFI